MTSRLMPQPKKAFRLNPWLIRLPMLFIAGLILLLVVLALFFAAFQMRFAETIYPNVYALGLNLSGMTEQEAANALSNRFEYGSEAVFTFRDGDKFWQMTAADLGVGFDALATAQMAFEVGRSGNLLRDVSGQSETWFSGQAVSPVISYDQNIALAKLEEMAGEIDREAVNASLSLTGMQVSVTEGQTGRRLDIPATLTRLNEAIM